MDKLFLLHPMVVHFPIALLTLGLALQLFQLTGKAEKFPSIGFTISWLLWLGTIAAIAAAGAGLLAEKTVPHLATAMEEIEEHEELGLWTAGIFTALSVVRIIFRKRFPDMAFGWKSLFALVWLASVGLLFAAARCGGELVYDYGVGVSKATPAEHQD